MYCNPRPNRATLAARRHQRSSLPILPLLALLGALCAGPAAASPAWLCSLSEDQLRLICVADRDVVVDLQPAPPAALKPTAGGAAPSAVAAPVQRVNGTAFPLDPARAYTVELFGPAADGEMLEQLARATMCYRNPACEVVLTGLGDLTSPQPVRSAMR
jgi:hypothetical protein